jgi:hypothetical protein
MAALSLLAMTACRRPAADPESGGADRRDCADVDTLRVCWDGARPRVVGRATRAPAIARGPAFACVADQCEQRHPRMPDAGEWQCMDSAGATICRGGAPAAGVAPSAADPRWFCGVRRGGEEPGTRICVDLSPDFPDGRARGWRCRTLYDGPPRRACDRDADAHTLAETCDARHPCVDGSRCAEGWCVPERPAPACWREQDCSGDRCRFGSCLPREP